MTDCMQSEQNTTSDQIKRGVEIRGISRNDERLSLSIAAIHVEIDGIKDHDHLTREITRSLTLFILVPRPLCQTAKMLTEVESSLVPEVVNRN